MNAGTHVLERGRIRGGIFRSVINRDVFPAGSREGFTPVRKMPALIRPPLHDKAGYSLLVLLLVRRMNPATLSCNARSDASFAYTMWPES